MTIGIALSVKSNLGVSPVSSIPYTMTCVWGIEMGKATIIFHAALVLIQIIILRKNFKPINLLQIVVGVVFGYFTTFCNYLATFLPSTDNIVVRVVLMLVSTIFIAGGIFFYLPANLIPLAGEGVMQAVSEGTHIEFSKVKMQLKWSVFRDFPAEKMYSVMQEWVFPFIKNLHSDKNSAYSKYMDDAIFKLPTPILLSKVVDSLDEIYKLMNEIQSVDVRGDVYEYLLSKIAQSGRNGQFRTPRHIIRMMVEMMDPAADEMICDPACGTSGFLVASGEYLREKKKEDIFYNKANRDHYMNHMFYGYDMDRTMLRIGAMNMMTHGIDKIHWDSYLHVLHLLRSSFLLSFSLPFILSYTLTRSDCNSSVSSAVNPLSATDSTKSNFLLSISTYSLPLSVKYTYRDLLSPDFVLLCI